MANPGTVLNGRFRLDQLVGQGGFAQVFLSTDLVLDRQVAVKVLRPDQIDDTDTAPFLERFGAEARMIARLEHPNILGLYDYGQSDGLTYLVMPYVSGGSLHDARRRVGRFSPPQVAGYLRQVAAALDYAHANNIVHRDIKPQNMLLRAGTDQLVVADFGIAKVLREGNTQSGTAVIGSAAYMAPEQFQGRVGRATDIYALGCVAFELLTGTTPYPGTAERSMFGHIYGELPRLDASLPGAPAALQATIDRALAKQPEDRFPTASAFAEAFAAAADAVPTRVLPVAEDAQTRRLDPAPITGQTPSGGTTPLPPAPPITGPGGNTSPPPPAPASIPPRQAAPRSLVPFLAGGVVALLVLIGIGAAFYLNRPDNNAATQPTATTRTGAATGPTQTPARSGAATQPTATNTRAAAASAAGSSTQPGSTIVLAERSVTALPGHTNRVERLAWSPNGDYLATASEDSTVIIWYKDGREKAKLTDHTQPVRALAWSPDDQFLATGSNDGFVYGWQIGETVSKVATIDNGGNTVSALAWNGTTLVIASAKLRFYSLETQTDLSPPADGLATTILAWSGNGESLVAGGKNGQLRLFNATGQLAATLQGHTGDIRSVAWSPGDDRFVAVGDQAILWLGAIDRTTGRATLTPTPLVGHTGKVTSASWSAYNDVIATGSDDLTVRLWEIDGTPRATYPANSDPVTQVAWLTNGTLVIGDERSHLRWWSVDGVLVSEQTSGSCGIFALSPAPDNSSVAVSSLCGDPAIWR